MPYKNCIRVFQFVIQTLTQEELEAKLTEMITKTKQLEEQLSEKSAELEKTQKEFRYKLSDISMELKAQQDRFSREIEKTKVI